MNRNCIKTWVQGRFVNSKEFEHMPEDWKGRRRNEESHRVRQGTKGPVICWCNDPEDAKWIAERLNLAAKLEREVHVKTGAVEGGKIGVSV